MGNDEKIPGRLGGDLNTHTPLPYVVRLKLVLDQDTPPQSADWNGWAYSLMEAILQALMEASGKSSGVTYTVEYVRPDLPVFFLALASRVTEAAHAPR